MINGVTKLVMTKADVLDAFAELSVCTAYEVNGKETTQIPYQLERAQPTPVWKKFPGWNQTTSTCKEFASLPVAMKTYVDFINKYLGVEVKYISNGPGRDQLVLVP
jgi:adenylosuccinate synthase